MWLSNFHKSTASYNNLWRLCVSVQTHNPSPNAVSFKVDTGRTDSLLGDCRIICVCFVMWIILPSRRFCVGSHENNATRSHQSMWFKTNFFLEFASCYAMGIIYNFLSRRSRKLPSLYFVFHLPGGLSPTQPHGTQVQHNRLFIVIQWAVYWVLFYD